MRISRPCYDKMRRCPGWIGGGLRWAKVDRCDNGAIQIDYEARWWKWRTWPCNRCDVVVLPYVSRYLDPTWLVDAARSRVTVEWRWLWHEDETLVERWVDWRRGRRAVRRYRRQVRDRQTRDRKASDRKASQR